MIHRISIFLIGLIVMFFISCRKDTKINYYYSNGLAIDTSNLNLSIKDETKKVIINFEDKFDEINIHTSLREDLKISLNEKLDTIYSIISEQYPDKKKEIDSLYQNRNLFKIGVLVINNKNGKVLYNHNYPNNTDQINAKYESGGMFKSFEYTMAMDKEFSLNDSYPLIRYKYVDSTLVAVPDTNRKISFYSPFCLSLPASINPLHERYAKADFIALLNRMKCSYDTNNILNKHYYDWRLSLFDLTKAHTIYQNKGELIHPSYIDSITDNNGITVFRNKLKAETVLNDTTAGEMMSLFEKFVEGGRGFFIIRKYKYFEPLAGRFSKNLHNSFWFIAISNDVTIGTRFTINLKGFDYHYLRNVNNQNTTIPIWYKTRQLIQN